jgi:hypothetical protein
MGAFRRYLYLPGYNTQVITVGPVIVVDVRYDPRPIFNPFKVRDPQLVHTLWCDPTDKLWGHT